MTKGHLTWLVMVVLQKQPVDLEEARREAVAEVFGETSVQGDKIFKPSPVSPK